MAEGKVHAMAIGTMLMSSDEIIEAQKGEAIQVCQYMNDSLWKLKPI
jgi:malignant T-cell-amplified sequence